MNNNILITGASGFIGSFLVEEALRKGYNVWAGIRQTSSKKFLQDKRINFIDLQYSESRKLQKQLIDFSKNHGNIDYIIHSAGITQAVDQSDFDKVNYGYTKNLLDALEASEHQIKKIIFISSLSVVGKGDEENYTPFDLSDTENPDTLYGESKLKAEKHITQKKDLPYIILRPTAVYGPRDRDFLALIQSIRKGLAPTIGYKTQQLSFIYVKDLVNAVFLALGSNISQKKYLLTDGHAYTDREYIELLKKVADKESAVHIKIPLFIVKLIARIGDLIAKTSGKSQTINSDKYKVLAQRNWGCNIYPIVTELNFVPEYDLKKGLMETIEWYEDNHWLQK